MILSPFGRKPQPSLDDQTFGAISMTSEKCWENRAFRFAGYEGVQLERRLGEGADPVERRAAEQQAQKILNGEPMVYTVPANCEK